MKDLIDYIRNIKEANEQTVYAIYLADGIFYNYFQTKEEAQKEADRLNNEAPSNKCTIKEEPLKNFQK